MTTVASTKATNNMLSIGMRPHLFDSNSKSPADLAVQRGQIDVGILVDVLLHFEIAFSPLTAKKSDKLLRHKITFEGRTIQYSVNKN